MHLMLHDNAFDNTR